MPFTHEIRKNTHFTTGFYSFIFLLTWFGTNIVLGFNFTFLTTCYANDFNYYEMDLCFYIRRNDGTNKRGETAIYCTITLNGISAVPFSTGIKVIAQNWLPKKKTTSDEFADNVRREINQIENLLRKIKIDLQENSSTLTANSIKEKFKNIRTTATAKKPKPKQILFMDMAKLYIENKIKKGASTRTKKNNNTFKNNIESYLSKNKIKNLAPHKIDFEFIEDFTLYFQHDLGNSQNYTNCHIGFISSVLDLCVLKKVIKNNPLLSLKLKYKDNIDNKGLTLAELEALEKATDLTSDEQKAVDIFLFLCGSGCDYCDYLNLTNESILKKGNILMLNHERQKTVTYLNDYSRTAKPILKQTAIKVLEKYGSIEEMPRFKHIQDVNDLIQGVAERLKIKTHLTTKRGRKTFTNISINKELHTDEQTAYQLGHSSTKQLKHYRSYDDDIIKNLLK